MRALFRDVPLALDFGDGDIRAICDKPANVQFAPPRFAALLSIMIDPGLRFGESFMDGNWHVTKGSVADLLLMMLTAKGGERRKQGLTFGIAERAVYYYKQFLATFRATRKVTRHYNVNTELYVHMIGNNLAYSSGVFTKENETLEKAQIQKFNDLNKRLGFSKTDRVRVLDIGCGWGSFERYFPAEISGEIDAISISKGQIDWAKQHVRDIAGGKDMTVNFIKADYREFCQNHHKAYSHVVSVGMLEHVGKSKYAHYFGAIRDVLTEDGRAVIHSIVKHSPGTTNLWIDRYIFPGGYAPMVSEVVAGIERAGLKTQSVNFYAGSNYFKTLQIWMENLIASEDEILDLLTAEHVDKGAQQAARMARTTYRMYIFYLSAVQLMFHQPYSDNGVAHFVVTP